MQLKRVLLFVLLLGAGSAPAGAETHITVDTASGQPGDPITIRAGYLQSESIRPSVYRIDSAGRLTLNGQPDVYTLDQPVRTGPFAGFLASLDETQLEVTSNFYAATGRLDGGNFEYEITSVTRVPGAGGTTGARFGFTAVEEGLQAISSGATREARSFNLGLGNLYDDEVMIADRPGLYDVSLVAWDSNHRYADSAPITFRINVVPEPVFTPPFLLSLVCALRRARRSNPAI
jgi:hypothetical protein